MSNRIVWAIAMVMVIFAAIGCGSSTPEHQVQPLASRPENPFTSLKTPEEKIEYIKKSPAPESAKEEAIAKIKAGKL